MGLGMMRALSGVPLCAESALPAPNPKAAHGARKVPMGLVPPIAEVHEARAFGEGAERYGPYNWRAAGVDAMTYIHAIRRHLAAYLDGEDDDPKSGVPHLAKIRACCAILLDAHDLGNLEDNRPPAGKSMAWFGEEPLERYTRNEPISW